MSRSYLQDLGKIRVALVIPHQASESVGNAVTANRIVRELESRGVEARIWRAGRDSDVFGIAEDILAFRPSVINGFHAFHFSRLANKLRQLCNVPLVVTAAGTDVNINLYSASTRRATSTTLRLADAVVTFCRATADRLVFDIQLSGDRIHVIPQAVELPAAPTSPVPFQKQDGDFVVLVPAGLRAVKNPLFCLAPLLSLRGEYPQIVAVFAGPTIESNLADELEGYVNGQSWVKSLGDIPHDQISSLIRMSDVVVNSSLSEGMSGALLEAMSLGIPILASNIEGNRAIIEDGVNGLLFNKEADFMLQMERLIKDGGLRTALTRNAKKRIERDHLPKKEVASYIELYGRLAATSPRPKDTQD
jgi:L-malate glycosyltransferase